MPWIEKREGWLPARAVPARGVEEPGYSVSEVAAILGITRQTVYKYLSLDDPDSAVIPPAGWWKLPGGHIRIRLAAVRKLKEGAQ